jgi:biotin operon repressor
MHVEVVSRISSPTRHERRRCSVAGCELKTREGKPFCSDHVEEHPYVQGVLDQVEAMQQEERNARKRGRRGVDLEGHIARELVRELSVHGSRSVERMARDLGLDQVVVRTYAQALEAKGLATLERTRRGYTKVELDPNLVARVARPRILASSLEGAA